MSKFDGVFNKTSRLPKVQTEETPKVQTFAGPKTMGRPPGKKSDPNYRQVTIYLPVGLHDQGREKAFQSQCSPNRQERQDFSEIVEEALRSHFKSEDFQKPKSLKVNEHLDEPQDADVASTAPPTAKEAVTAPPMLPVHVTATAAAEEWDDAHYERDRAKMEMDVEQWVTDGKITTAEKRKIVRLYDSKKPLSQEQVQWISSIKQRAQGDGLGALPL